MRKSLEAWVSCCGVVEREARAWAAAPGELLSSPYFSMWVLIVFWWILELDFDACLSTLFFLAP